MYSTNRIEHISDQLGLYMEQVAKEVKELQERFNFPLEIATQVAKIAAMEHIADTLHHAEGQISDIADGIYSISRALE